MGYLLNQFTADVAQKMKKWNAKAYAPAAAELDAIAVALGTDTTKHDKTIEAAPAGLKPGHYLNTPFTNDILGIVNMGKAGNLTTAAMAGALQSAAGYVSAPVIQTVPFASGQAHTGGTVTCTKGNWLYDPTTYTYQWLRAGVNISGATGENYVIQAADVGNAIACTVTATNHVGSASSTSNAVHPVALARDTKDGNSVRKR